MTRHTPLLASERTSAALLDMQPAEFRALVEAGALPPAGPFDRWAVEDLRRVATGEAAHDEGLEL